MVGKGSQNYLFLYCAHLEKYRMVIIFSYQNLSAQVYLFIITPPPLDAVSNAYTSVIVMHDVKHI